MAVLASPRNYKHEDDPYDRAITYEIASPSGTELALKHYPSDDPGGFSLTMVHRGHDGRLQEAIDWTRLERSGLGRRDNVVLNWDGDTRVTVAGPSDKPVPSGPDYLGGVQITYARYVRGRTDLHGILSATVTLTDVTYSTQRIVLGPGTGNSVICLLRVEGRDDQFHRLIGFDVNALGQLHYHLANATWSLGEAIVGYTATYLPEATGRPSLTQGIIRGFPVKIDPGIGFKGPIQNDVRQNGQGDLVRHVVIYQDAFWPDVVVPIFDLMRDGRFEAVYEFGLGAQAVTYRFTAPVPRAVAEQFATCEATTNIDHAPDSLSRHLMSNPSMPVQPGRTSMRPG